MMSGYENDGRWLTGEIAEPSTTSYYHNELKSSIYYPSPPTYNTCKYTYSVLSSFIQIQTFFDSK